MRFPFGKWGGGGGPGAVHFPGPAVNHYNIRTIRNCMKIEENIRTYKNMQENIMLYRAIQAIYVHMGLCKGIHGHVGLYGAI